jgi:threonine/homoserine/homoserine lactone efflux protein
MYSALHGVASAPLFHPPTTCMTLQEFSALLVLGFAMSFSPGPNNTLSAALAANLGFGRALRFACAVPVGWGVLLALCAAGLGGLIVAMPALRWAVKLAGVGYLLWLALKLSQSGSMGQPDAAKLDVTFLQGAALQFVNIKAWMFALAVVAGWIAGRADALERFAIVAPVMMAFAFVSNVVYAAMGALLRDWLSGGARLLWFNRAMGLVLVGTALWMLTV